MRERKREREREREIRFSTLGIAYPCILTGLCSLIKLIAPLIINAGFGYSSTCCCLSWTYRGGRAVTTVHECTGCQLTE